MIYPWIDHNLAAELNTAIAAVREAGLLCRRVQSQMDRGALEKKDKSPVTVADFGSQALICSTLVDRFGPESIIGEEDSAALRESGNESLLSKVVEMVRTLRPETDPDTLCQWIDLGGSKEYSPRFWTLDPIDGTKGFLRGQQYAISLALLIDGVIEVAVVGCPNLGPDLNGDRQEGTVFAAIRGAGVWQLPLTSEGKALPVRVSPQTDTTMIRFCESVEAAHSSHGDAARIAEHLNIQAEPARLDSQTKYAVVCRGEAEAYLRLPRDGKYKEKIWDHAGGVLILTEAGGRVTDIRGNELDFTRGFRLEDNLGVIVTNGHTHEAVIQTIEELGIGQF